MSDWDNHIEQYGNEQDVFDGFEDNIYTHKEYGNIILCIKEKGNFAAIKNEFIAYRDNAYSAYDDDRFVFINDNPDDIPNEKWQELQDSYVEYAKEFYEDRLWEDQIELFDFENRDNFTLENWHPIFEEIITKQEVEKRTLERAISYSDTKKIVFQSQPSYEPGTYFTDAVEKINQLNSTKKPTFKL